MREKSRIWIPMVVIFTVFVDNMGQQPLISPYAVELGATALGAALMVGVYSAANVTGNLVSPGIMIHLGQGRTAVLALLSAGIVLLTYGLATNPLQMAAIRVIHGLMGGILVPAIFCCLGDSAPAGRHGVIMGRAGAAIGAAAVVGPLVTGLAGHLGGFRAAFSALGAILLGGAFLATRLPQGVRDPRPRGRPRRLLLESLSNRTIRVALAAAFALMMSMGTLGYRFPLLARDLGLAPHWVGMMFSLFAASALVLMAGLTGQLSDRVGRRPPILGGLALVVASLSGLELLSSPLSLAFLMVTYGAGFGLVFPSMNALVLDSSPAGGRGPAFGVFHAFFSAGVIAGPILAGLQLPLLPFLRVALVILIGMIFIAATPISAPGADA